MNDIYKNFNDRKVWEKISKRSDSYSQIQLNDFTFIAEFEVTGCY